MSKEDDNKEAEEKAVAKEAEKDAEKDERVGTFVRNGAIMFLVLTGLVFFIYYMIP